MEKQFKGKASEKKLPSQLRLRDYVGVKQIDKRKHERPKRQI